MLEVYYAPSSCAFAVLVALEKAKVPYRAWRLDLAAGDQRSADYRTIHPLGRVPAIVVDGTVITEVTAVLAYIAHAFPDAGLLPFDDPVGIARCFEMLSWFSSSFHLSIAQIFRGERFSDDPAVQAQLKEPGRRHFAEQLARLDKSAAKARHGLIGDRFTIVDAFALVIWRWATKLEIDMAGLEALSAFMERLLGQPFVQAAGEVELAGQRWLQDQRVPAAE